MGSVKFFRKYFARSNLFIEIYVEIFLNCYTYYKFSLFKLDAPVSMPSLLIWNILLNELASGNMLFLNLGVYDVWVELFCG